MGIHLIYFTNGSEVFESHYFENYDSLIEHDHDFPKGAIVYEAEKDWSPHILENHPTLKKYTNLSGRVGRRGELIFQKMAEKNGYIAQEIDQEPKKYKQFLRIMG